MFSRPRQSSLRSYLCYLHAAQTPLHYSVPCPLFMGLYDASPVFKPTDFDVGPVTHFTSTLEPKYLICRSFKLNLLSSLNEYNWTGLHHVLCSLVATSRPPAGAAIISVHFIGLCYGRHGSPQEYSSTNSSCSCQLREWLPKCSSELCSTSRRAVDAGFVSFKIVALREIC